MGIIVGVETKDVEAEYLKNVTGNLHERVINSLTSMRAALQKSGEAILDRGDFSGFQRMALDFDPTNQKNWVYKSDMAKFFALMASTLPASKTSVPSRRLSQYP